MGLRSCCISPRATADGGALQGSRIAVNNMGGEQRQVAFDGCEESGEHDIGGFELYDDTLVVDDFDAGYRAFHCSADAAGGVFPEVVIEACAHISCCNRLSVMPKGIVSQGESKGIGRWARLPFAEQTVAGVQSAFAVHAYEKVIGVTVVFQSVRVVERGVERFGAK